MKRTSAPLSFPLWTERQTRARTITEPMCDMKMAGSREPSREREKRGEKIAAKTDDDNDEDDDDDDDGDDDDYPLGD